MDPRLLPSADRRSPDSVPTGTYSRCTSAPERLIEAARGLLWGRGHVGTDARDVQRQAGAGRGSMYRHVAGRTRSPPNTTGGSSANGTSAAPIAVRLEPRTAALDVLGLFCGELTVAPQRVLGHAGRSPDAAVRRDAARTGAFLAFDAPSRSHHATDRRPGEAADRLRRRGLRRAVGPGRRHEVPGTPSLPHPKRRLRLCLEQSLEEQALAGILVDGTARALAWRTSSGPREG